MTAALLLLFVAMLFVHMQEDEIYKFAYEEGCLSAKMQLVDKLTVLGLAVVFFLTGRKIKGNLADKEVAVIKS